MSCDHDLWLASSSPRRAELLTQLGVDFRVHSVPIDETPHSQESAHQYVQRMAQEKASIALPSIEALAQGHELPVLAAYTVVVSKARILTKPHDEEDAIEMLGQLSGQTHEVMTAVCVAKKTQLKTIAVTTQVSFRELSMAERRRYWHTGEPKDKAGGYGIQGFAAVFLDKIVGSYTRVVGLPLSETAQVLAEFSVPFWLTDAD